MSDDSNFFLNKRLEKINTKYSIVSHSLKKLSYARLVSFFSFFLFLIILYIHREHFTYLVIFPSFFIILFIYTIRKYNEFESTLQKIESYIHFLKREKLRSQGNQLQLFREDPPLVQKSENTFWRDLDLFGKQGLYSYIDTTVTQNGNRSFLSNLLQTNPPNYEEIIHKQERIKEITKRKQYLWKLLYTLFETSSSAGYTKINLSFQIESINKILKNPNLKILYIKVFLITFYTASLIFFLLDQNGFWVLFFLIQFILYLNKYKKKNIIIKKYNKFIAIFYKFKKLITYVYSSKYQSKQLREKLNEYDKNDLINLFSKIEKLQFLLSYREIPLPGFLLNLFFAWDYWILKEIYELEKYKSISIQNLIQSIELIDSSLPFCVLSLYEKDLEFPEVQNNPIFTASSIGHPLIKKENRIYNPVPNLMKGDIVILTGSNMSGKTTYLRSLGINILLANCGSQVFAKDMKVSPLKILTSIKNEDSLDQGISFFYSEVRKLSYILKESQNYNSIILIDEILKGTNTRERLIATRSIMRYLSKSNSFNYITTHDIELANEKNKYLLKHFTEIIENEKMGFDYLLRDGVITSGNALKILKIEIPQLEIEN